MIRINLLPHREEKRKALREQFYVLFGLVMASVFRRQARRLELTCWQDWTAPH